MVRCSINNSATWIRPINLEDLLKEVLFSLEGESVVVLEGKFEVLSKYDGLKCSVPVDYKNEAPGSELIAFSLIKNNAKPIYKAITNLQDWPTNIKAMQILYRDQRAFLAADSFHEECISIWPAAPNELINELVSKRYASLL